MRWGNLFDLAKIKEKHIELEDKMSKNDFWDNQEKAQIVLKEAKKYSDKIKKIELLDEELKAFGFSIEVYEEDPDISYEKEIKNHSKILEKYMNNFVIETLLKGEYDSNNAILSIHSGAGGTDAQDWAEMLLRMYSRWAESSGYKVEVLDLLSDNKGGIKSVTLQISGNNAYGYLKSEVGVHRIVRISPFDASGKRHTSFAAVEVLPELDENVTIDIDEKDLRIDTYRASGAGGQHVNKTDSAIRITHIPTGIVVQCQNERSQMSNRKKALNMLMSKLIELKEREHKESIKELKGNYNQITWGSQIRSYVFHPYSLVKDHRTSVEKGNVQKVMDGDLDDFISAFLKMHIKKNK
jgi:peptide chain release factor 2